MRRARRHLHEERRAHHLARAVEEMHRLTTAGVLSGRLAARRAVCCELESQLKMAHSLPCVGADQPQGAGLSRLRGREAHRFAVEGHRARRNANIRKNPLDGIDGIGALRKRALLYHFGSGRAVGRASLSELEKVEGIVNISRTYKHNKDIKV